MSKSRWRLVAAGATVIVSAVTGVLTNVVTSRWNVALGATLGVLVVVGVVLQVVLTGGADNSSSEGCGAARSPSGIRQRARAGGRATIIQAGRDVIIPPGGVRPPESREDPQA
jgi:hypothetical protein